MKKKQTRIDIIERQQEGDRHGPYALGTVEVEPQNFAVAMDLMELWLVFQDTEPDADSNYITWLVKRRPRVDEQLRKIYQNLPEHPKILGII